MAICIYDDTWKLHLSKLFYCEELRIEIYKYGCEA
jgi:hypothetical protein